MFDYIPDPVLLASDDISLDMFILLLYLQKILQQRNHKGQAFESEIFQHDCL